MAKTKISGTSKRKMIRPKTGVGVEIPVRCKDCIHFTKVPLYNKEPCNKLGVESWSKPCKGFTVDPHTIKLKQNSDIKELFKIVRRLDIKDLAPVATIIATEQRTRRNGLYGGQEVFLCIGEEYLASYVRGFVISCTAEHVFIEGSSGFEGTLLRESLLTLEKFKVKRSLLQQQQRLLNPDESIFRVNAKPEELKSLDYLPPLAESI